MEGNNELVWMGKETVVRYSEMLTYHLPREPEETFLYTYSFFKTYFQYEDNRRLQALRHLLILRPCAWQPATEGS
jgi:hypothetical protein